MRIVQSFCLLASTAAYNVQVERLNNGQPIFGPSNSVFDYNYNAAFMPENGANPSGLLVRCQRNTTATTGDPYSTSPSVLAFTKATATGFEDITNASVVISPDGPDEDFGTEDPRVVLVDDTYYLLYSAVHTNDDGSVQSLLSLATSETPIDAGSWTRHGALFPDIWWSKSGSLLVRDEPPHYLYWGDSTLVPGMQLATSYDLLNFTTSDDIWLPTRDDFFDSGLVEGGPMPLLLDDGNYFMLYNSARHGYSSKKPGYDFQYNVGWVVLNGSDPQQILERSQEPILSPELDWEVGVDALTPNVVFTEGWHAGADPNTFVAYYGAADEFIGAFSIKVTEY